MGYYIQAPTNKGKADYLIREHGAKAASPSSFNDIPPGKAAICVINNGPFEAAAYAYSAREFEEFSRPDIRSKQWVYMDKTLAEKLSGYSK